MCRHAVLSIADAQTSTGSAPRVSSVPFLISPAVIASTAGLSRVPVCVDVSVDVDRLLDSSE